MSDFGAFFGKIAGKVANAANSDRKLKCYGCDKITGHISISYAYVFTAKGSDSVVDAAVGVTFDLVPGVYPIMLGNSYACNDCKRIRFEGGILSNELNTQSPSYL